MARKQSVHPGFVRWLQEQKQLGRRSAGDVKSHVLRVSALTDLDDPELEDTDVIYQLSKSHQFASLNLNTQSHLRRAVRLYKEFIKYLNQEIRIDLF